MMLKEEKVEEERVPGSAGSSRDIWQLKKNGLQDLQAAAETSGS